MKRYYITRVLGEGSHENLYYSELRRYVQSNWPGEPHFIKQAFQPLVFMWGVMAYNLSDEAHADVMANLTGIFSFPSGSLDTTVGSLIIERRQAIRTKLENIGFEFSWATLDTTIREILRYLICSIHMARWAKVSIGAANFNLNTIVADVPVAARQKIARHMQDLGIDTSWITTSHTIGEIVSKIQRHTDGSKRLFGVVNKHQLFFQDTD